MINNLKEEEEKLREQEIMLEYDGDDKIITSKQAWDNLEEERNKPAFKIKSKIPLLDKILDGFRTGDLIVISGITKQGKTTFCQTLTYNFAQQDIPCLWFSFEMAPLEFLQKFKPELPHFTLPTRLKTNSLEWLEKRIIESQAKYGTKVVFIDHLHFLLDMQGLAHGNTSLIIGGIMRELKKIALYREITIILVAHTVKIKFDNEPELSDIRDSSFIGQEADTVLMIWRRKVNGIITNETRLAVLANRRTGENGKINLLFKDGYLMEEDISHKVPENYGDNY
jgi:replicative DNA helicase